MSAAALRLRLVSDPLAEPPSDEELLLKVATGDREAFRTLVQRYGARLAAFCSRQVGDATVGEDLAQDVLVAAWRARERFAGGDPAAWLFTFAVNRCRKHRRGWARWLRVERGSASAPAEPPKTALDALEKRALEAALVKAIDGLPPLHREAVLLRFEAGLDYRTIGQVAGCSEGAARARAFDAVAALRAHFQDAS